MSYQIGQLVGVLLITFLLYRLAVYVIGKMTDGPKVAIVSFVIVLLLTQSVAAKQKSWGRWAVVNFLFVVVLLIVDLFRGSRQSK